jgi:hypothetical protein
MLIAAPGTMGGEVLLQPAIAQPSGPRAGAGGFVARRLAEHLTDHVAYAVDILL